MFLGFSLFLYWRLGLLDLEELCQLWLIFLNPFGFRGDSGLDKLSLDGRLMGNWTFGTVAGLEAGAVAMGFELEVVARDVDL